MKLPVFSLLLISTLASSSAVLGSVIRDEKLLESRATCSPVSAPLTNGNFESGSLTPWYYRDQLNSGRTSATIITPGVSNSKYAVQLSAFNNNAILSLTQNVTVCNGTTYDVSFQLQQVAGQTVCNISSSPAYLYAEFKDADGGQLTFFSFQAFGNSSTGPNYYKTGGTQYPAGQWKQWSYSVGIRKAGTAMLRFELIIAGSECKTAFKVDSVTMTKK